ncbi:MAG: hypothetical protein EOP49_38905, partial [Sphingobacteriales bacterium]
MKYFIGLILTFYSLSNHAQIPLWEPMSFRMDEQAYSRQMYYDESDTCSYIYGAFHAVNDTLCNIIKLYPDGTYTLLPPTPHVFTVQAMRYRDKLYVNGDSGIVRWSGTGWERIDSAHTMGRMSIYQDKLLICGTSNSNAFSSLFLWNDTLLTANFLGVDSLWTNGSGVSVTASYKGQLYIAGNFNDGGGDPDMDELARFDGTRWRNVGGQLKGNGLTHITDMLIWHDSLYVSGQFN